MSKESKELEDAVLEEFEWALQDPNSEKIRQLGEVVSIITTKLTEAISELQGTVNSLQAEVNSLDNKLSSLASRVSSGATVSPAAGGASPAAGMASDEPIAAATPKPAAPAGGGMSMMGELKQLLAARRRKAETGE